MASDKPTHIHIVDKDLKEPIIVPFNPIPEEQAEINGYTTETELHITINKSNKFLVIHTPYKDKVCHYCITSPETAYFVRGEEHDLPLLAEYEESVVAQSEENETVEMVK